MIMHGNGKTPKAPKIVLEPQFETLSIPECPFLSATLGTKSNENRELEEEEPQLCKFSKRGYTCDHYNLEEGCPSLAFDGTVLGLSRICQNICYALEADGCQSWMLDTSGGSPLCVLMASTMAAEEGCDIYAGSIDSSVSCFDGEEQKCDPFYPTSSGVEIKPTTLVFKLTGGTTALSNPQSGKAAAIGDTLVGGAISGAVCTEATANTNGNLVAIQAWHGAKLTCWVSDGNSDVQQITIHVSGSKTLMLGDRFGALTLVDFHNEAGHSKSTCVDSFKISSKTKKCGTSNVKKSKDWKQKNSYQTNKSKFNLKKSKATKKGTKKGAKDEVKTPKGESKGKGKANVQDNTNFSDKKSKTSIGIAIGGGVMFAIALAIMTYTLVKRPTNKQKLKTRDEHKEGDGFGTFSETDVSDEPEVDMHWVDLGPANKYFDDYVRPSDVRRNNGVYV